jgi:hypothetical protein
MFVAVASCPAERPSEESAMAQARWWLLLLAVGMAGTAAHAQEINWQEAVARLAQERTQAETCAGVLKKYGDHTTIDRRSITYGEAKAEYDGVIAGLTVALARNQQPASLPSLQDRLQRGFEKREALCSARARRLWSVDALVNCADHTSMSAHRALVTKKSLRALPFQYGLRTTAAPLGPTHPAR